MKLSLRPLLVLGVLGTLSTSTGCFLVSADFEGDVNVLVDFLETDDNTYEGVNRVDPNDYDEYRDNKDRIKDGELIGIDFEFFEVDAINAAEIAEGQVDFKDADEDDSAYELAIGKWEGVAIEQGNRFPIVLEPQAKAKVDDLLFGGDPGPLDIRIVGEVDRYKVETSTIAFTAQITLRLRFTAGL